MLMDLSAPPVEFKAKPFWSWNGHLEPEELSRQIRIMRQMGFGGFFMHSRTGLDIPYLSEKWFELVEHCVKEAEKLGMEAWLYDEDRWPSGSAGGFLTSKPEHRRKYLIMKELEGQGELKDCLAAFTGCLNGDNLCNVKRVNNVEATERFKKEKIFIFKQEEPPLISWYNGYTYPDTLNHETIKEFIKITHEKYREHLGKYFGKTVPGIFTDEPTHGPKLLAGDLEQKNPGMPWTPELPEIFKKRYGYDLLDHLPELFYDLESQEVSQARYHYHDCVTFLFVDAFARQTGEWCRNNNISFTGHILDESPLSRQAATVGSCMRFYEHMQIPGMDILTQHKREFDTAKQISSAARQFGARWRLSETYGCTGWGFSFAGHKAVGDWQTVLGINLRCHHLLHYTLEGFAKRDYPGSIFYQSPWWQYYSHVEDYFSRIHVLMTRGEEIRDLLVIHPIESMWLKCRTGWENSKEIKQLDKQLMEMRDILLENNIDFDYVDEEILSRHGKVKLVNGNGNAKLFVAKADYKAVLVPPLSTIRSSTLALLEKFAEAGGMVLFTDTVAKYVDALKSSRAEQLTSHCLHFPELCKEALAILANKCRRVSITDAENNQIGPVLQLLREDDEAFYIFLCNTGHDYTPEDTAPSVDERNIIIPDARVSGFEQCEGAPLEVDLLTGKIYEADSFKCNGKWEIKTSFPKVGSRLFIIPKAKTATQFPGKDKYRTVKTLDIEQSKFPITLTEYNNLPLDQPRWQLKGEQPNNPDFILNIDDKVRETLEIPVRDGMQVQPWKQKNTVVGKSANISLEYSFQVKHLPEQDIFLGIEKPELYNITLNGNKIAKQSSAEWWMDKSLRLLKIPAGYLFSGKNILCAETMYNSLHPGLETVFIVGNFGVTSNREIEAQPEVLKPGNWTQQGLAFYSGLVSYHMTVEIQSVENQKIILKIPRFAGIALAIKVNDMDAGVLGWEPYQIDITNLIKQGSNRVEIQVFGHRRNSHGPLHYKDKEPPLIGPGQFIDDGKNWCPEFRLLECGITTCPQIIFQEII